MKGARGLWENCVNRGRGRILLS